jgi:ABC-2 type transport system permease protein
VSGVTASVRRALDRLPRSGAGDSAGEARSRPGWQVVAAKEFADHILSVRFYVLLAVLGVAALIPIYFAVERIRNLAEDASGASAVFLALFTLSAQDTGALRLLQVVEFVGIVAPLLGLIFAFDAINGERHEGTLPRLLSQPIHRDDVINGKFVAGIAIIGVVLAAVVLVISGFGLVRLGIVPRDVEVARLIAWYLFTGLYVAMWLAFGLLLSVVIARAATSALVGLGTWLFVALPAPIPTGQLMVALAAAVVAPLSADPNAYFAAQGTQQFIVRLLPSTLYREGSIALLNPFVTTTSSPTTLGEAYQLAQQLPTTTMSFDQSLLIIWPHIVVLLAVTAVCFALAYVAFMRQEIRA